MKTILTPLEVFQEDRVCSKCNEGVLVNNEGTKPSYELDDIWFWHRCTHCNHETKLNETYPKLTYRKKD